MASGPVTEQERQQIRRLHGEGLTRNDIARRIGRSPGTITNVARRLGLTFERGQEVVAATEARRLDLAARRVALAESFHQDAERLRAQLWQECTHGEFAGKEGNWHEVHLPRPRFVDQKAIITAASTAVQQSLKLVPAEGSEDADQVRSMLGTLGAALTHAFGNDTGETEAGDGSGEEG